MSLLPSDADVITTPRDPDETRTFSNFLARCEEGVLDNDLTEKLSEIVKTLRQRQRDYGGKPVASLSLEVSFKLDDGMIEVRTGVKVKVPKEVRGRTLLFPSANDLLTSRNPRQRELALMRDAGNVASIRDAT